MSVTHEAQADQFLQQISLHQKQLLAYAVSLAKCPDAGYDLYADTLLRCRERIVSAGFFGSAAIPYMVTAIRLNFYAQKKRAKRTISLEEERHENIMDWASDSEDSSYYGNGKSKGNLLAHTPEEDDNSQQLANAISTHIAAHYPPDEVAVFELHVAGVTYPEIAFLTQYTYWQAYDMVRRMKREIREMFKGNL